MTRILFNLKSEDFFCNSKKVYIYCLLLSLSLLLIATKSSLLYPFNDWVDPNASFTMGKALMNGRVLYRDIFDHRGPLLYFLFGLAYLLSNTSFLGVFIFEIISFSVFLFFSYKTLRLCVGYRYSFIALPLFAAFVVNLGSYGKGGSPEEFCLPLIAISFYHLFAYFRKIYSEPIPTRWVLMNGIIAGCVLWIKFSLLGFWFGWVLAIIISLLMDKKIIFSIKTSILFLSGMLLATLPWVIYFGIHCSISDWINAYFVINLTSYSAAFSFFSIARSTLIGILYPLYKFPFVFGFISFGVIVFIIIDKFITNKFHKILLVLCYLFLALSVFSGGRMYNYYYLIFSPIIIFGFIAILTIIHKKFGETSSRRIFLLFTFLSFVGSFSYTLAFHHNSYMLKLNDEDLIQNKFAQIINQTEDATLLNYGVLDLGFYTTTGIVPNIRFFYNPNIEYSKFPLVLDEQNRYVKEGVVDFVVTVLPLSESQENIENSYLFQNYYLIKEEIQTYEKKGYFYLLFKKK